MKCKTRIQDFPSKGQRDLKQESPERNSDKLQEFTRSVTHRRYRLDSEKSSDLETFKSKSRMINSTSTDSGGSNRCPFEIPDY